MFEAYENFIQKFDSWKVLNRISVGIFRWIPFSEILPEGYAEENVTAAEEMLVAGMRWRQFWIKVWMILIAETCTSFALADSSQHAAGSRRRKNLVIEGLGTGKSQTIVELNQQRTLSW